MIIEEVSCGARTGAASFFAWRLRQGQCRHLVEAVKAPVYSLGNSCGQNSRNETSGDSLRRTMGTAIYLMRQKAGAFQIMKLGIILLQVYSLHSPLKALCCPTPTPSKSRPMFYNNRNMPLDRKRRRQSQEIWSVGHCGKLSDWKAQLEMESQRPTVGIGEKPRPVLT